MINVFGYAVTSQNDSKEVIQEKMNYIKEISLLDDDLFEGVDFYFFKILKVASKMSVLLNEKIFNELINFKIQGLVNKYRKHTDSSKEFSFNDESGFASAVKAIALDLLDYHKQLIKNDPPIEDYKALLIELRIQVESDFMNKSLIKASNMLVSPEDKQIGVDQSSNFLKIRMMQLDQIRTKFDELLTDSTRRAKPRRVCSFGVSEIDSNSGGVYTTEIISIEGPPGYGKTTVTLLNPVYQALASGHNVLYLSVEQTEEKLKNMILSRFIYEAFGIVLTSKDIIDEVYTQDPTLKTKVDIARHRLFSDNSIFGKFIAPPTDELYTNTIIDEVERNEAKYHTTFDMVVIDYMYNLDHKRIDREVLNLADKMKEGYKQAKHVALFMDKSVIVLNQLTDSGVEAIYNGQLLRPGQVAGGHASTHYTSEDYILGGTEADRSNDILTIQNMKMREGKRLPRIPYKFNPIIGTLIAALD